MDKLKVFIQAMTIFNWLTLIAFLFASISVLNALLSLKTRFRDWRGTQSKKAFEKRVKQLERELVRIQKFAAEPQRFHSYLLERGTRLATSYLIAIAIFMTAFGISVSPFRGLNVEVVLAMVAVLLLGLIISAMVELSRLIRMVSNSKNFAVEIVKFIVDAREKGFELEDEGVLMTFLKLVKSEALAKSAK